MFLINYKTNNQIDYNKYVGRYFERITPDQDRIVFRIDSFDGKYFRVTQYLLTLGFSTKKVNQGMYTTFLERSNFKEITEAEFDLIKYLCIEPFVTIYDNNSNPIYYREYSNKRRQDTMNEININGKKNYRT